MHGYFNRRELAQTTYIIDNDMLYILPRMGGASAAAFELQLACCTCTGTRTRPAQRRALRSKQAHERQGTNKGKRKRSCVLGGGA